MCTHHKQWSRGGQTLKPIVGVLIGAFLQTFLQNTPLRRIFTETCANENKMVEPASTRPLQCVSCCICHMCRTSINTALLHPNTRICNLVSPCQLVLIGANECRKGNHHLLRRNPPALFLVAVKIEKRLCCRQDYTMLIPRKSQNGGWMQLVRFVVVPDKNNQSQKKSYAADVRCFSLKQSKASPMLCLK